MASSFYYDSTLEQMVTNNKFNSSFYDQLRRLSRNDSALTTLDLSYNRIGDTEAIATSQALSFNSTLTELNLSRNQIGDTGAASIMQVLSSNSTLTELNLSHNQIGPTAIAR